MFESNIFICKTVRLHTCFFYYFIMIFSVLFKLCYSAHNCVPCVPCELLACCNLNADVAVPDEPDAG